MNARLPIGERTLVMGVLNVTPDSFSDGGLYMDVERAVEHGMRMVDEGADIIDVGGESTRPGAAAVSAEEEMRRVLPVVRELALRVNVPLSIDTTKSTVADAALAAGAAIVNDISGLKFDPALARAAARHRAYLILGHTPSTPSLMQAHCPLYASLLDEVAFSLRFSIESAVASGVDPDAIIVDPGIGFGKDAHQNLFLLNRLDHFKALGKPILVGTSRKSFIAAVTDDRTTGTAATVAVAVMRGASIVRVHDVAQMRTVTRVVDAVLASCDGAAPGSTGGGYV